ncbi:hypothetical protein [Streptomyces mirabilis]|uniref:hypothetical protein n=1 Tax=Streptomyces mirabilis TaxID=68239 RepID=UPI0038018F0D
MPTLLVPPSPTASLSMKASPTQTARAKPRVVSASCTGEAKNMTLAANGHTVTKSSSPNPAYLQIKKARLVRDSRGVTVSYTLAGVPPHPASDISSATYWTWLGDGYGDVSELSVSMEWLNSKWRVVANGPVDVVGGTVDARPVIHGHTVSVRVPLHVAVSTGWDADLSKFTHVGWSTEGEDPLGLGSWADGCPVSGDEAGNPGSWEVKLR